MKGGPLPLPSTPLPLFPSSSLPFSSSPSRPLYSSPSTPFPSPSLRSRLPLIQLGGLGSAVSGARPPNVIWCILGWKMLLLRAILSIYSRKFTTKFNKFIRLVKTPIRTDTTLGLLHDSVIDMHGHMSYITHVICLTEFVITFFIVAVLPLLWWIKKRFAKLIPRGQAQAPLNTPLVVK